MFLFNVQKDSKQKSNVMWPHGSSHVSSNAFHNFLSLLVLSFPVPSYVVSLFCNEWMNVQHYSYLLLMDYWVFLGRSGQKKRLFVCNLCVCITFLAVDSGMVLSYHFVRPFIGRTVGGPLRRPLTPCVPTQRIQTTWGPRSPCSVTLTATAAVLVSSSEKLVASFVD